MNVLISACLLGLACRYDGQSKGYSAADWLRLATRRSGRAAQCGRKAAGT